MSEPKKYTYKCTSCGFESLSSTDPSKYAIGSLCCGHCRGLMKPKPVRPDEPVQEVYVYRCENCKYSVARNTPVDRERGESINCMHCARTMSGPIDNGHCREGLYQHAKFADYYDVADTSIQANDQINQPAHYITPSGLESVHVIEAFGLESNFYRATTVAYLLRAGRKGGKADELKDLKKAQRWLGREVKRLEGKEGEW